MLSRFRRSLSLRRPLLCALLLGSPMMLSGCWLFAASEQVNGQKVDAQYLGLTDKSVAIVIYTDQATSNEFPAAREEISSFVAAQMRENLPKAQLLDYHEILNWQDDTLNWFSLSEQDIGKHFSVDRVLYIELLDYSVSPNRGYGDLQGRLRANCKVFETDAKTSSAAWSEVIDVRYPESRPMDAGQTSPDAIRSHTLQDFAEEVVNRFYTHGRFSKPLKDEP